MAASEALSGMFHRFEDACLSWHESLKFYPFWIVLQSLAKYLGLTLVSVWDSTLREGFDFCFSRVFCYCWLSFHFRAGAGRWAIISWGLDTFSFFLISKDPKFSATRDALRIYHVYK